METIKKDNKVILLIIFVLLVFAGLALYNYRNSNNSNEEVIKENEEYKLLNDYSRFFTVNSCVYKYIQYLQKEDFDSLFKVLDNDFVNNANISSNNIYNYLPNISDGIYNFVSKKIYYTKVNDSYITYYVYGYMVEELMDSVGVKEYYTYKVNLDTSNQTFSIAPYNGDLFEEELNG